MDLEWNDIFHTLRASRQTLNAERLRAFFRNILNALQTVGRYNVYIRLRKLLEDDLINKGFMDNHADTYYITQNGLKLLQ